MPLLHLDDAEIFYRDEGSGPAMLLAHSSTASSGQWRRLIADNRDRFRLLAPDLRGYGKTSPLPPGTPLVEAELALIEAVMAQCEGPLHLVGHSYGGSLALRAALRQPEKAKSLTVIEPTLFHLLAGAGEADADAEIRAVGERVSAFVEKGDPEEAARGFIAYWVGPGAFDAMEAKMQAGIVTGMSKLAAEWRACFAEEPVTPAEIAGLSAPLQILCAEKTTLAARRTTELLRAILPHHRYAEIPGAGHMSPLTHPALINPLIVDFVTAQA